MKYYIFLFLLTLTSLHKLEAQNPVWRAYVQSLNNYQEPDENLCDVIQNGYMGIPPNLSSIGYYWTAFQFLDTFCITNDFTFEIRLKINASTGGIEAYDTGIDLKAQGGSTGCTLMGVAWGQSYASVTVAGNQVAAGQPWMVMNLSDWSVIKMAFRNNTVTYFYNGTQFFSAPYTGNICNLNGLGFGFKGSALIDWISIKDASDNSVYFEDFNSCTNFARPSPCNAAALTVSANTACEGGDLRLTSSIQGSSYSWTGPNGFTSTSANPVIPNVTTSASGNYTLTTNINACQTLTNSVDVTIAPMSTRHTSVNICEGQTHTLPNGQQVNTNGIYTNIITPSNSCDYVLKTNLTVTPMPIRDTLIMICQGQNYTLPNGQQVNTNGIYTNIIMPSNSCAYVLKTNLTLIPMPIIDTTITICQGQNYTRPNGLQVNTQNVYIDTLFPPNNCYLLQRTNLIVRPAPRIFLGNDTTLCTGTNHILNLSNWNANILWNDGSTNRTFNAQRAGSISVIVTHLDGCVSKDTIQINESAYPIVNLGNDTAVCNGQSVQLRAQNAGCRYLWSTGATGQTIQATQTGNHSVTVINIFGCSKSDTVQVTVAPLMTSTMTTLSEITCNNLCNGKAKIIYNNAYAPVQIAWSNGNRTPTAENLCTGRYTATITDSLGCTTQNQVNIANPAAIQALTFVTSNYNGVPISCKSKTDGTAKVVSSGGTGAHTTEWLTQPPQTTIVATGLGAGITRVVITDINGCKDTASIQLTEPDSITVYIAPIHPICEGNSDGKITFSMIRGGIAPYALSINAQKIPSITSGYNISGLKAGVYQMRVNDVNNCLSTTYEKSVLAVPKLQLLVSNDTVINLGDSTTIWVQVTNRQNALITYKWLTANTLSCDTCATTFAKPIHPTDYHVICKDDNGCASEKIVRVKVNAENVVFIPNAFSPNGDDTNDKLTVFGSKAIKQVVEFKIFNRWGNLIYSDENFQPNDKNHGWDGRFNGKELSLGVFVWYATIELIDGSTRTISGDTTILK